MSAKDHASSPRNERAAKTSKRNAAYSYFCICADMGGEAAINTRGRFS
jgi:hypothetical protein